MPETLPTQESPVMSLFDRLPRAVRASTDSLVLVAVLVGLIALFGTLSDYFWSRTVATTIANRIPPLMLVTVGMTWVLIVGGIDLSVGSIMALTAGVFGYLIVSQEWSIASALVVSLACGLACGAFNGWLVVHWSVPSFIVTLGMMEAARGAAYLVTGSSTQYIGTQVQWLTVPRGTLQVSIAFGVALLAVLLGQLVLQKTVFGRHCIATGDNDAALRLSGIDPRRTRWIVFAVSGLLAGLAGVIETARMAVADPNSGTGMELAAIAAAVIGGTSLAGGRGSIVRSFLGVLIISVLQTGLDQVGATDPVKRLVTGGVIVLAVIADAWRRR